MQTPVPIRRDATRQLKLHQLEGELTRIDAQPGKQLVPSRGLASEAVVHRPSRAGPFRTLVPRAGDA